MSEPQAEPTKHKPQPVNPTIGYIITAVTFFFVGAVVTLFAMGNNFLQPTTSSNLDEEALRSVMLDVLVEAGVSEPLQDMVELADDDPYIGEDDAPITIVEFSAYACPYCSRHFEQTFVPLLENYGQYVKYVYRDYPIINPNVSYPAALAANCADEQDAFWEYHELLFANQSLLGSAYFQEAAMELDLDIDAFNDCYSNERYTAEVEGDLIEGQFLEISGTPTFYINGRAYSGALPYEYFERVIEAELDRLGINY